MAEPTDAINFKAASKKIILVDEILKDPEFQKTISKLATKSESEIEKFAESELTLEAFSDKGIEIPKGIRIVFKPASANKTAMQKKRIMISLMIPGVGTLSFRSALKDKPAKAQD